VNTILKSILGLVAFAAVAGCNPINPDGAVAEMRDAKTGGPVNRATFAVAYKLCNERATGLYRTEDALYGPYKDVTGIIDDAKACMLRHGVRVLGFRQKDGRLTRYPIWPKYLDY
jgi:hypothetical protein